MKPDIEPVLFECDCCGRGFLELFEIADEGWLCARCTPQRVIELPEPKPDLGAPRALTDRITAEIDALRQLALEAWADRAWEALGYPSWDDYCAAEFDAGSSFVSIAPFVSAMPFTKPAGAGEVSA